jgi:hypothetical protein
MKTVWFVIPLLMTMFGFAVCANFGVPIMGVKEVAAPIAAGPPMSNA